MEMKYEMDRRVYDALILGSETAIETNKTEVKRKVCDWYGRRGGRQVDQYRNVFFMCGAIVVQNYKKIKSTTD